MMRWKATIWTAAVAFATFAGCAHREFLTQEDYDKFHRENHLPLGMDTNPTLGAGPVSPERPPVPPSVDDPERKPRHVTLAECIAHALERGNTGIQSVRQLGTIDDDLLRGPSLFAGPNGFPFINADSIRVLSLNPAISGLGIDQALSRYDTGSVTTMGGSFVDQPIQGFNSFSNGYFGRFASTLFKELPAGGLAAATFGTQYQNLSRPPINFPLLNPAYTPSLQFTFEQPLWQNFGTDINQLLTRGQQLGGELSRAHPEATQFLQGRAGSTNTGASIMLSRIRFDQSRTELERAVNFTLVNVEVAYWNLYGAYVNLYSSEMALRQSYEAWKITKAKYEAGLKEGGKITDFAQTRGQYEQFRGDRLQALGRVLEAERVLRSLMGLPSEDGTQLVPVDTPTVAPYRPDWGTSLEEALTLRPELVVARHELKALQFDLTVQKNFLKPDVRLQSSYRIDALGTRLDGNGEFLDQSLGRFRSDNAFRGLASNHYNSWNLGVTAQIPLGYRFENAAVR
ncbi:MAG: TolC family protein, partial [Gemmataceae bacterium]|nr:TolC family protein [Gemmataceae bacterium]